MSKKKSNQSREEFKEEEIVQAVVIADSFNVRFAPLTKDRPRALLPLANVPLLDYTLEFLVSSGIQEIIVYCCAHADLIKQHLQNSRWMDGSSECEIKVVVSEECLSAGDALRNIDAKSLIKSDFVLVNGDMVSNMKLADIIKEHKERRVKDKNAIMTMVMRTADPGHRTRCSEEEVMVTIKPDNSQLLQYQKGVDTRRFSFPLVLFQENKQLQLRYDLLDCHISVCSPNIPPLYSENFDYETKEHFIKGILVNEEILGHTIHVHILEETYAARVSNMQMYDAVSKDVLNRWTFPLVPDCNITNRTEDKYNYGRHNIYMHKSVELARGSILKENVVVGSGTKVKSKAFITQSVIGKNCTIGENVAIEGAYVWDNVVIGDNCVIKAAVLGNGVHVLNGVKVQNNSIFSTNVKVGPFKTLPEKCILVAEKPHGDSEVLTELVGAEGQAYRYQPPVDSDDEGDTVDGPMWGLQEPSDQEDLSSDDEDLSEDEGSQPGSPAPDDSKLFYGEVMGTLKRALEDNIGADNIVLEINSLKAAYGMEIKEVIMLVTQAVLQFPLIEDQDLDSNGYLKSYGQIMKKFLALFKNYVRNSESQVNCLTAIEDTCLLQFAVSESVVKVLHHLYNCDILSEEFILKWYSTVPDGVDQLQEREELRKKVEPLIKWLEEAEEESSEDSD